MAPLSTQLVQRLPMGPMSSQLIQRAYSWSSLEVDEESECRTEDEDDGEGGVGSMESVEEEAERGMWLAGTGRMGNRDKAVDGRV